MSPAPRDLIQCKTTPVHHILSSKTPRNYVVGLYGRPRANDPDICHDPLVLCKHKCLHNRVIAAIYRVLRKRYAKLDVAQLIQISLSFLSEKNVEHTIIIREIRTLIRARER